MQGPRGGWTWCTFKLQPHDLGIYTHAATRSGECNWQAQVAGSVNQCYSVPARFCLHQISLSDLIKIVLSTGIIVAVYKVTWQHYITGVLRLEC